MKQLIRLTIGFLALALSLSSLSAPDAQAANMKRAALQAGTTLALGAAMSGMAAKKFFSKCFSPGGYWACPLAVLSAVQAGMNSGESAASFKTGATIDCKSLGYCVGGDSSTGGSDFDKAAGADMTDPSVGFKEASKDPAIQAQLAKLATISRDAKGIQDKLAEKGYSYDPSSGMVNTPKGPVNASSLGDPGAMAAAGFTKDQIADAMEVLKQAKASGPGNIGDGGYGGGIGGGRRVANANEPGLDMSAFMRGASGRKPASLELNGMKKYLGNEPIGLAVDNIFDMVHRQYQTQNSHGNFLP